MVVQILGKEHLEGISSKTGKPYNISKVYISFSSHGVEGLKARELFIPNDFDFSKLLVNQHYNFDSDFDGRLCNISPAK